MPILSKFFKSRADPQNNMWQSAYNFFFGPTSSGKVVNERTAMQTSAVYACVRILAETIASLPLHTYERTDKGKEKALDHPLYYLLHDEPNPEMTSFVFRETLMGHLLLWGNAFAQIIRDGRGQVKALYPLMPDKMTVHRNESGELYYSYKKEGQEYLLRNWEVLHIPGLGFDGLVGHSPIAMAKNAIGMAIATEEYGATFFNNGANPGGVLEHPGILKDPERVRKSWNSVYGGSGNAHKVAVLEEGLSFKPITIPPEQSQFLQTRKFQLNEIGRIFRIPPHMIGDLDKSSFSNIEQQSLEYVKYTLTPWLSRWEMAMKKALLSPSEKKDYFIKLNVEGLLRGDYKTRMEGYATGIQNGFLSPNDVRQLEDMNTIENGDVYAVNGNMLKLEDIGAYAKKELKDKEKGGKE
ncbi:phage portal protein [Desulfitispora alkaliphila]|uniref:phage portal protein n=1 Tax=Desulfitispora alkaliphila TaxID=622674 RepID=UPI003D1C19DB